ncbi:MAG TPA: ATP-grasp domain-containing protein [Burkholderiaceae bacterium]|nr:ATP-grasp domain-containing protein [Burkholderiaceae bacterium]
MLFLGSVRAGEFETILRGGRRLGVILDEKRGATLPAKDAFDFVARHDFSRPLADLAPVLQTAREKFEIVALINLREFYVRSHAYAAALLGLPALPVEAVDLVLNKTLMRKAFVEALGPSATPHFRELGTIDEAIDFGRQAGYPLVLKPNNLYGSLFVRIVHDEDELRREFPQLHAQVVAHSTALGVVQSLDHVIQAEEFVSGTVHSIECLIDRNQRVYPTPVVDVLTGHDVGQAHFGHVVRKACSHLPSPVQHEMTQMAVAAVKALKLRHAAAHVEFIASAHGPKLLEIAARPGGHRNRVMEMTHGIAFNEQYLKMLLGHEPDLSARFTQPFAILTPYPGERMVFDGVRQLDAVTRLASYHHHEVKVQPGTVIGPARSGFMSSWIIELCHEDQRVLDSDMAWLIEQPDFFEEASCVS